MNVTRFVGPEGCATRRYTRALQDPATAVIDTLSAERNVTLRFRLDGHPVRIPLKETRRDLVDLALSVYIADELALRSEGLDGWARDFDFLIPVFDTQAWKRASPLLGKTLRFLSGDHFTFTWPQRHSLPTGTRHRTKLSKDFDAVCLFSGGIDSLLGAISLLESGKHVLLVGHQAEGATAAAQTAAAAALRVHFPDQFALLQCRVARAHMHHPTYPLPRKVEETHRPRSFLFLSVAAAIAHVVGVPDVYIPENGLIALNIPLQQSRLGTLSTRTAHPIFLRSVSTLFRDIGILPGTIRNPFMYLSKTDMLRTLDPRFRDAVLRSVSCSRPTRYQNYHVRHCGYCVPCIYRRGAMIASGLDRAEDYAFDVFQDLHAFTKIQRADFRALVGFAKRVAVATDAALERMVLAHGPFSPAIGGEIGPSATADYTPWTSMLQRWARDFLGDIQTHTSHATKSMLDIADNSNPAIA